MGAGTAAPGNARALEHARVVAAGTVSRETGMGQRDARIDAYIAGAVFYAQPILTHLRARVHAACPGANDRIKWGFPRFEPPDILCSITAFMRHCAFGFWHGRMRTLAAENVDRKSPSRRREYGEWIDSAKRPESRLRRLAAAGQWIAEGKSKEWKYRRS